MKITSTGSYISLSLSVLHLLHVKYGEFTYQIFAAFKGAHKPLKKKNTNVCVRVSNCLGERARSLWSLKNMVFQPLSLSSALKGGGGVGSPSLTKGGAGLKGGALGSRGFRPLSGRSAVSAPSASTAGLQLLQW